MDTTPFETTALFALTGAPDGAPEWVQVLPPQGVPFEANGSRFLYEDADALITESLTAGPVIVDINHATNRLSSKGQEAPAYGRVTDFEARDGGIWARIEWNRMGAELMASQPYPYSGVSPVLDCIKRNGAKIVLRIRQVSLTNVPALGGQIASLTEETDPMMSKVAKALGLAEDADEDAILAAIAKMKKASDGPAEMTGLITALGAEGGASVAELTLLARDAVAKARQAGSVEELTDKIETMQADAWIEKKITEGRVIDDEIRAELTEVYRQSPDRAEKFVARMASISPTHTGGKPPADGGSDTVELTAEDKAVAAQLGLDPAEVLKTKQAEKEAL